MFRSLTSLKTVQQGVRIIKRLLTKNTDKTLSEKQLWNDCAIVQLFKVTKNLLICLSN